jgi:hypothetical protein
MPLANNNLRPFFLPTGLDIETLPPQLGAALLDLVSPFYERHVVCGTTPLEVATGVTVTFLLAEEIITEFEIGQEFFRGQRCAEDLARRQKQIDALFRVLGAKMRFTSFLQRIAEFRQHKNFDHVLG